jgi:molybdopterin synthase catalytic subunit/molybdopterin/thiamine biosynthesis adenylyltransferase
MFDLVETAINIGQYYPSFNQLEAGAVVCFEGRVRNHNHGEAVLELEYQAYPQMVIKEGELIISEAKSKFPILNALAIHRHGKLALGDIAILIIVNSHHRDAAYQASRYIIDEIKLRLPIWKLEKYESESPRWVFCKDHLHHHDICEVDFYHKQAHLLDHKIIASKKVAIIGLGALGSPLAMALAGSGVGEIHLFDNDLIELGNLARQPFYSSLDIGISKTECLFKKIKSFNPLIKIEAHEVRIKHDNISEYIQDYSLVIDCTDNFKTRDLIHDHCFNQQLNLLTLAIYNKQGSIQMFDYSLRQHDGCKYCFGQDFKHSDKADLPQCSATSVLAAHALNLASTAASECLEFLEKNDCQSMHHQVLFWFDRLDLTKVARKRDSNCHYCTNDVRLLQKKIINLANAIFVDANNFDPSVLEELSSSSDLVLYCEQGELSYMLATQIRQSNKINVESFKRSEIAHLLASSRD